MDPSKLLGKAHRDAAVDAAAQAEFNGKRRVWIPDPTDGFLPGWIKEDQATGSSAPDATAEVVVATTGEVRIVPAHSLSPMNPPQFDGVEDIAELTHLNEASVVNDLRMRYGTGSIYTYSGLFLISLNPYRPLPIYTPKIIAQYRTKRREENAPHIFAIAERAWQQIGEERESQSILITGESGAGKTENTKKVIQYLAAIATASEPAGSSFAPSTGLPRSSSFKGKEAEEIGLNTLANGQGELGLLERQILQANPILEAFGNAQTMRNNNSSRFGKFIRIFFSPAGAIAGANIDWYLLEKSRVTARAEGERNFHVFYQLLRGAEEEGLSKSLLLEGGPEQFEFLKKTRLQIDGVDDLSEWRLLKNALGVVGFDKTEQYELFRVVAVILHIGNIVLTGSSSDQAFLPPDSQPVAERVCHLLGIPVKDFMKAVLSPKVRAGREWVTQARSKKQAEDELGALSKFMYEKTFGWMVGRINKALDRPSAKSLSIGVLDIAGFEIFVENSFEQLLINFTNERLQQFFNFHMFTLEQEEYTREGIKWEYVNFGLDLQPTIELIESTQPIGILSLLDEECIMPKATDLTFTEKVQALWETPKGSSTAHSGTAKFRPTRFGQGFVIKHYAGDVEYRTDGWLQKNKDPINDAVARLLVQSEVPAIASLFAEYAEDPASTGVVKRVKRGAFRTVGQRHKEQLGQLMQQLASTQPHFVRCIVPNSEKKPGKVDVNLVLDQLRCNGVLEGIRIARLGFPNRHSFAEFRQRYEVLAPGVIPRGYMDGRKAAGLIAEALDLDPDFYKIGATKIFFKAGILAELEERRDNLLTDLFRRFQSAARMHICRRRINKLVNRAQAVRTIQRNARAYIELRDWPWWSLYVKVRPLLAATRTDDELARKQAELAVAKERAERDEQEKKRLEELRAGLVAEKEKVEKDLISERDLAFEKDQILTRSKAQEARLQDKVKELELDLEKLDAKREEAVAIAEHDRDALTKLQQKYDQLKEQAHVLEEQGVSWRHREAELLRETKDRSVAYSNLENEKLDLSRVVDDLRLEVAKRDDQSRRAKEKREGEVEELQKMLQYERKKSENGTAQITALTEDLSRAEGEYKDLQRKLKSHEDILNIKERDLAALESKRLASVQAHEAIQRAQSGLQVKIDSLKADLDARDKERQQDAVERAKLENSLDELRKVMDAKSSEDIKRREADRSREAEMADLRQQVVQLQKIQDQQRENAVQLANKLRIDIDSLRQRHSTAERDLSSAHVTLQKKDAEMVTLKMATEEADKARKQVLAELETVRGQLRATEREHQDVVADCEALHRQVQDWEAKFTDLEDALIPIEHERDALRKRLDETSTQLSDEISKRQVLEGQVHDNQAALADYRNELTQFERELAQSSSDIKVRDDEIALLRSRENKTIVEHVHVLESAKKMTDRQLADQVDQNKRLNLVMKSLETHRNRLQADLDDLQRAHELLRKTKGKEARAARASMGVEDKDTIQLLDEERKARAGAEAKVASLERDLQDQRRKQSTTALASPSRPSPADGRLVKMQEELVHLEKAHELALSQNQRLTSELADLQRIRQSSQPVVPKTPTARADLLRGLQQSHDALGRDMSDQLRKLDSAPLTPSRRHNSSISNGGMTNSPSLLDLQATKRIRTLETEINGLRQQLEDEREEKEFLYDRMQELEGGDKPARTPFPFEQAMYSHFRLKAKSLRSQLDHWLAMEDLNANNSSRITPNSTGGAPFTEDVQRLKQLLSQLDPDSSPLRAT